MNSPTEDPCQGLFTVSVSISICDDANKWVQLTIIELFTFNEAKHQRNKMQTLALTLNRPLPISSDVTILITFAQCERTLIINTTYGFVHTKRKQTRKRHHEQVGCIVFYVTVHTKLHQRSKKRFAFAWCEWSIKNVTVRLFQIIFVIFVAFFVVKEARKLYKTRRLEYFKQFWNYVEMVIIVISFCAITM